jgi:hypothetical protein
MSFLGQVWKGAAAAGTMEVFTAGLLKHQHLIDQSTFTAAAYFGVFSAIGAAIMWGFSDDLNRGKPEPSKVKQAVGVTTGIAASILSLALSTPIGDQIKSQFDTSDSWTPASQNIAPETQKPQDMNYSA